MTTTDLFTFSITLPFPRSNIVGIIQYVVFSNRLLSLSNKHLSFFYDFVVVQLPSNFWLFMTPWTAACQTSLSFTVSWSLLKILPIELMMPTNHLILYFPFSSCPQSFPASGSFPMSWLFTSGGQRIRASASASVLPINIQSRFPLGLTSLISLLSKGLSRVFSSTMFWKHQFFGA